MEIKAINLNEIPQHKHKNFSNFPKFNSDRFDPDIDLTRKGNGYRYATKSEKRKRRDKIKQQKIDISKNRRKGVFSNINQILGVQIFKSHTSHKNIHSNGKLECIIKT